LGFDTKNVASIRSLLPAVEASIFMNTGGSGPLPVSTIEAIQEQQTFELVNGRMGKKAMQQRKLILEETRIEIAKLINAHTDEITITHSTTQGINIVLWGISWKQGDEVITSDVEHPAVLLPLYVLKERQGIIIKTAELRQDPVNAVVSLINDKTRLIAISHVSYSTGEVIPIKEITQLAHRFDVSVLIDGAQSAGAIPIDVKELGIDYYSIPGQKWLCGPQGTGALFIKHELLEEIKPSFVGYGSVEEFDFNGTYRFHRDMSRFEAALPYLPAIAGLKSSIKWLLEGIGVNWIYERTQSLGENLRKELLKIQGITVVTPAKAAGLTSFRIEGIEQDFAVDMLSKQGVSIRLIKELNCVRASIAFFNTEQEVEILIDKCRQLLQNK